jgi:hypothetical protein
MNQSLAGVISLWLVTLQRYSRSACVLIGRSEPSRRS